MRFLPIILSTLIFTLGNLLGICNGSSDGNNHFHSSSDSNAIFTTQSDTDEAESSSIAHQEHRLHSQSYSQNYRRSRNIIQNNQPGSSGNTSSIMDQSSALRKVCEIRQKIANLEMYRTSMLTELQVIENTLNRPSIPISQRVDSIVRMNQINERLASTRSKIRNLQRAADKLDDQ